MNVEEQLHFDGGEMLMVHDVFRREFALMPALVRGVAVGDHNRAQIVTDHIERGAGFGQPRRSPLLAQRLDSVVR
jgi:hypothetical protein